MILLLMDRHLNLVIENNEINKLDMFESALYEG